MDLTGIVFDTTTLEAGGLLVIGFVAMYASIRAVINMVRRDGGGSSSRYDLPSIRDQKFEAGSGLSDWYGRSDRYHT